MNTLIQHIINQGVPQETVAYILILPVVATIIVFARQIIGVKGFGIYTPLIIAFAFLATGLEYGLLFFLVILFVGTLTRLMVKKTRLLYLPRIAIVLTVVVMAIFALFTLGAYTGQMGLVIAPIIAVLIMITLVEKFVAAQIERGARSAILLTIETLVLSLVCYFTISWTWLQNLVLYYGLWIILATALINILLGKWTGLRLAEYFRFREVIKHIEISKKD